MHIAYRLLPASIPMICLLLFCLDCQGEHGLWQHFFFLISGMADNFDLCECIYNQEASMQRLLSVLRQSQAYCNDVLCQSDPSNPLTDDSGSQLYTSVFAVCAWALAMAGVYAYRTIRQRGSNASVKPRPSEVNQPRALMFILIDSHRLYWFNYSVSPCAWLPPIEMPRVSTNPWNHIQRIYNDPLYDKS